MGIYFPFATMHLTTYATANDSKYQWNVTISESQVSQLISGEPENISTWTSITSSSVMDVRYKTFRRSNSLTRQMIMHTGEKPL